MKKVLLVVLVLLPVVCFSQYMERDDAENVLYYLNEYRKKNFKKPVEIDFEKMASCNEWSRKLSEAGRLIHHKSEKYNGEILAAYSYGYIENKTWSGSIEVYKESKPHAKNMRGSKYKKAAIGGYYSKESNSFFVTIRFYE